MNFCAILDDCRSTTTVYEDGCSLRTCHQDERISASAPASRARFRQASLADMILASLSIDDQRCFPWEINIAHLEYSSRSWPTKLKMQVEKL